MRHSQSLRPIRSANRSRGRNDERDRTRRSSRNAAGLNVAAELAPPTPASRRAITRQQAARYRRGCISAALRSAPRSESMTLGLDSVRPAAKKFIIAMYSGTDWAKDLWEFYRQGLLEDIADVARLTQRQHTLTRLLQRGWLSRPEARTDSTGPYTELASRAGEDS